MTEVMCHETRTFDETSLLNQIKIQFNSISRNQGSRSQVVPSGRQNTKYKTEQFSCFVFCILSRLARSGRTKLKTRIFNFVFCHGVTKQGPDKDRPDDKKTSEFCHLDPVLSRHDKIQN